MFQKRVTSAYNAFQIYASAWMVKPNEQESRKEVLKARGHGEMYATYNTRISHCNISLKVQGPVQYRDRLPRGICPIMKMLVGPYNLYNGNPYIHVQKNAFIKIRGSEDRLIFLMGILVLVGNTIRFYASHMFSYTVIIHQPNLILFCWTHNPTFINKRTSDVFLSAWRKCAYSI